MTLHDISSSVAKGLPFKRDIWPDKLYYYYNIDDQWFVQANTETGCLIIMYTLDLKLEDLLATDWTVDQWDESYFSVGS